MIDEAARFTAEHSLMESGMKVRELEHKIKLLEKKLDKIEHINNENGATALTKQVIIKSVLEANFGTLELELDKKVK
tara:strand:+ start:532 stop:762 length:231 start_codon:yes stop_codon:yes gene_type:complete